MSNASKAVPNSTAGPRATRGAVAGVFPCLLEQTLRVYLEDTDAGGIVYHASWLKFFERARTDWLRQLGIEQSTLGERGGIGFVVRDMYIDFIRPGRLDQLLRTELRLLETRKASLLLHQQAQCVQTGTLLAQAEVRVATIRLGDARPVALPSALFNRIELLSPPTSPKMKQ